MPTGKSVAEVVAEMQRVLASELTSRKFTYPRSNGSPWTLALKDVIDRAVDLEMAYNPNDCVEIRWGAPAKSEEVATCKRYAPQLQRAKMVKYRAWFRERRRPARAKQRSHSREDMANFSCKATAVSRCVPSTSFDRCRHPRRQRLSPRTACSAAARSSW